MTKWDDKTPTRPPAAETLGNTAVALSTAAEQLLAEAHRLEQSADRCARDALLVKDLDPAGLVQLLEDLEEELGIQAEALHSARRHVRNARLQLKGLPPR